MPVPSAGPLDEYKDIFSRAGIGKNVPVPLFLDNSWYFPAVFLALLELKAIPVLVKKAYRRMELDEIFSNLEPGIILCDEDFTHNLDAWTDGVSILVMRNGEISHSAAGTPKAGVFPTGTVSVNYTYRGYGYPLGAMIGESGYLDAADRYQRYVKFSSGDRVLALLPMSHIFTLVSSVILPLRNGLTTYILNSLNPKSILEVLDSRKINYLSSIPEILMMLARLRRDDAIPRYLKVLVSGGSFLSAENHSYISRRFGLEVLNGYGLTEMAPVTANLRNHGKTGTLGEFCHGLTGRISRTADTQIGEIHVAARDTFFGYHKRRTETADVMDGEWFRTGDLGSMDDGHIAFSGELKGTRKVNGQLVDLKEVERALMETGIVKKARVDGETNHLYAEVLLSDNSGYDEREVQRFLRQTLGDLVAAYKIPRTFKIV